MALIISPQAGMCNRFRAICSTILMGELLNKPVYHMWVPLAPEDAVFDGQRMNFTEDMQRIGWETLFKPHPKLQVVPPDLKVTKCFSEWLPGDPTWWRYQSYGQKKLGPVETVRLLDNADSLRECQEPNILVETSLAFRATGLSDPDYYDKCADIYLEYFQPQERYWDAVKDLPEVDIVVAVRRTDMLYVREANYQMEILEKWIQGLATKYRVVLFSEDENFRTEFTSKIPELAPHPLLKFSSQTWEQGFVEFLYLAHKTRVICGTPGSSFAWEASKVRDVPFYYNLTPEVEMNLNIDPSRRIHGDLPTE